MYINILTPEMKLQISYEDFAAITLVAKCRKGKITSTTVGQIMW